MFEVGFSELLLICVIALIVLGPQRLPKLAQQVGRWMGRARNMARQFREQLEDEANAIDIDLENEKIMKKQPAEGNRIAPPAAAVAATTDAPASSTLATGVPPDDDFAHHDAPAPDPVAEPAAESATAEEPAPPSTDRP